MIGHDLALFTGRHFSRNGKVFAIQDTVDLHFGDVIEILWPET